MHPWLQDILEALSRVSPFFARPLLESAVKKKGKNFDSISAADLLHIIRDDINPSLSKNHLKGMNPFLTAYTSIFECSPTGAFIRQNNAGKALLRKLSVAHKLDETDISAQYQLLWSLGFTSKINEIVDSSLEVRMIEVPLDGTGTKSVFNVVLVPVLNQDKAIISIISIVQNQSLEVALQAEIEKANVTLQHEVESRKQIERTLIDQQQKLIISEKMASLGEMAGGIAHEINNPLAIITMRARHIAHLLKDIEAPEGKRALELVAIIENTAYRISRIVQGMRAYSRNGDYDPFLKTSVASMLEDVAALCSEKIKAHSIDLKVCTIDPYLEVNCRATQIGQVLLNLITNSFDAVRTLKERWIRLDVHEESSRVIITVEDSGQRIADAVAAKMFQPFYTTKEVGKGTGLGLSISKGIVEEHGGSLYLDPDSSYTRFVIVLPKSAALQRSS